LRFYTKIAIWENQRRLNELLEFRELALKYFNNSRAEWMANERIEEEEAKIARVDINRIMDEVHDIILYSGIDPSLRWSPPPAVGGYIQNVNIIQNIFHIHRFRIPENNVLDFIDRAIGIYESNKSRALVNTFNPLFYLSIVVDWLVELPFVFIGRLGFNRDRVESSIIGRLMKGVLYLVTIVASFLTILQLLGYLEPVKQFVRQTFGSN